MSWISRNNQRKTMKPSTKPLTLDQLIAFCDELRGLTRAGVPLGRGLSKVANDLPGRLGELASQFGAEAEAGQSIDSMLSDKSLGVPPVFHAVLRAGIKSGRLPATLESLARSARITAQLQKTISIALVYPLLVLSIVALLAYFVLGPLTVTIRETSESQHLQYNSQLESALYYAEFYSDWILFVPPILIAVAIVWWWQSRKALAMQPGLFHATVSRLPWIGKLAKQSRLATFAESLALLVEHDVALQEAIQLSAQATGDVRILQTANQLCTQIDLGGKLTAASQSNAPEQQTAVSEFPPILRWLLLSNASRDEIARALRIAANTYRKKAEGLSRFLRLQLPILLSIVIGGASVSAYTFAVVVPWFTLMFEIGNSISY